MSSSKRPVVAQTKAKVNLYLHITGKRDDGYHLLDSLVAFANCGDEIALDPGAAFAVEIDGPFAAQVDSRPDLVEKTVRRMTECFGQPLDFTVRVTKNLPVAAGIGGGSGDAALMIRLLCKRWALSLDDPALKALAAELGADVPVCLAGKAAFVDGVGERFYPALGMPNLPAVLVNNGQGVSTPAVFKAYGGGFRDPDRAQILPRQPKAMAALLADRTNVLENAALTVEPGIRRVLDALGGTNPLLARMSGSGGTCFALFDTIADAERAAEAISASHPDWWVRACTLA